MYEKIRWVLEKEKAQEMLYSCSEGKEHKRRRQRYKRRER